MKKKLQLKRTLATFAALLCLMPLTAWAQNSVSTITTTENITKTSTVYVGEVVVDGQTTIKYLYSGDVTINNIVMQNLLVGLNGMADTDFAALLEGHEFEYTIEPVPNGFAICSNPDLVAAMDENWNSAQYVGTLYFPTKSVTSEINSNLYDMDEGFKAAIDAQTEERKANIDMPFDAEKCMVSHIDSRTITDVYYTIEDGIVVRHSDITVIYDSEATTVIYTKVELASGSTSSVLGDVNGDGDISVNDVAMIVNYILGIIDSNFIIANADANGDGEIDINDVMGTVSIILEGDNTPQAYLTCPDDNHPHMIDLGLPSGTLWACCNVGAATPQAFGGYYAWGETEEKDIYNHVTYKYASGVDETGGEDGGPDGYYDDQNYDYQGEVWVWGIWDNIGNCTIDEDGYKWYDIAGTQYDVAHVQWGGSWVMPSLNQVKELLDNCDFTWWTTSDGINGGLFSNKTNGKSIFLPAAGSRSGDDDLSPFNTWGWYWSSTQNPYGSDEAYGLHIHSPYGWTNYHRYCGYSVRPVWVP